MHLIIQGRDIATRDLKELARCSEASGIERITGEAFRLVDADPETRAEVGALCAGAGLDWGFVPPERTWHGFRLLAMDMDSTLIGIECIDEIADFAGVKPQVAQITGRAMRGEIAYTESLRARVALLRGLPAEALERVWRERLTLSPGAGRLLDRARAAGLTTLLVSGGFTFFTERLKAQLSLDHAESNTLEVVDGVITGKLLGDIVDAEGKARHLERVRRALGLVPDQVIAIGDGANDLPMLAAAGTGIAYRAKPVVQAQADYAINHVGLEGVVALFEARGA